ncbi:glycogen debranching enzyme GlgX, partial [Streptomyces sp. SID11233]|nr:glycogen debranching enzyme GlgX [Streptomyces sp. SID11233]
ADGRRDVAWFTARGTELTEDDWYAPGRSLGMYLSGRDLPARDAGGAPVVDDSFLLFLHADPEPAELTLPGTPWGASYEVVVDTAREGQEEAPGTVHAAGAT